LSISKSSRNSTLQLKSCKCNASRSNHPGSTFLLRTHVRTHALAPAVLSCLEAIMEGLLWYGALVGCPTAYDVAAQSGRRIQTFQRNLQSSSSDWKIRRTFQPYYITSYPRRQEPSHSPKISHCREKCALLGVYAATTGNFSPMLRNNLSVPSSGVETPKGYSDPGAFSTPEDGSEVVPRRR